MCFSHYSKVPEIKSSAPPKESEEAAFKPAATSKPSESTTTKSKPDSDPAKTTEANKDTAVKAEAKEAPAKESPADKAVASTATRHENGAAVPKNVPQGKETHMDLDPTAGKKRAREADDDGRDKTGGADKPSSPKKVDIKTEVVAAGDA